MKDLLEAASARLETDVDRLVEGGAARGRVRRRRRHLLAGVGTAAAVGVVATSVALLPGLGDGPVAEDGSGFAGAPSASASVDDQAPVTRDQQLRKLASGATRSLPPVPAQVVPDAPLSMHDDAIHDQLAAMLPPGDVGPILTRKQNVNYVPSDVGTDERGLFFTYDGTETQFTVVPAREGGCAAWLAAVETDRSRSYGECRTVGEATVVTEQYSQFGGRIQGVNAWAHGYQLSVFSSNVAPFDPDFFPAPDSKKREVVTDQPPIDLDTLTQIATSDVWFG